MKGDGEVSDIQDIGVISDRELTVEEMGQIKRAHWSIENRAHPGRDAVTMRTL